MQHQSPGDSDNSLWSYDPRDIAGTRRRGIRIGMNGFPRSVLLVFDPSLYSSRSEVLAEFSAMRTAILADPNALKAA